MINQVIIMIIIISMIMIMISMIRIKLVVRTHKTLTDRLTLWTVLCLFNKSLVPIIHIIIIVIIHIIIITKNQPSQQRLQ